MSIEIINEPDVGGQPIRALSGQDGVDLIETFHQVCNFKQSNRSLKYGHPPIFNAPDWKIALIPDQIHEGGQIFGEQPIDETDMALLAFYGVSIDFAQFHWPPAELFEPLWRMLKDRRLDKIAIAKWSAQGNEVFLGAPHEDAVGFVVGGVRPYGREAGLECGVFDPAGTWAVYSCIEDIAVMGGQPEVMDDFAVRAGGWGWLKAVFAMKYSEEMKTDNGVFRALYDYAGWEWPLDEDGQVRVRPPD